MRILSVNPYFSERRGAVDRRVLRLAAAFKAAGHEARAVHGKYESGGGPADPKGTDVTRLPSTLYDAKGYEPPFLTAEGLSKALGGPPCDIVDIQYMWTADYTRSARKLRPGTPIVFTLHNAFARGEGAEGRAAYLSDSVLKFFMRNCDLAVCLTDFIRRDLRGRGIPLAKLRTVRSGVTRTDDADLAALRAAPRLLEGPYAAFVGRIERTKGLDVLVEAARNVKGPLKFVIAGAGPEAEALKAQAHDFKVADRFVFEGFVPEGRKRQLIAQAEFFVYPATFEPSGVAVLEALDLGCPVLATSVGGLPEVLGEAARYTKPGDDGGLAAAINELAGDAAGRKALARDGRARAEASSWQRAAREMVAAFEEVVRP